ncbi:MAG: heme/hemin ABC transporter substrate-binding protein [Methyloligellaceae bacterium]
MRLLYGIPLFLLLVAASQAFASERVITDGHGRKITVGDTSRIVSIGGSVTEIIYALGEQDRIVARDSTSSYPSQALSKKNIGYVRALSSEGVLSVKPTLILALDGAGPPEVIEVLEKASVPMLSVPHKFSEEGVIEKIRFIGDVLEVQEKSEKLIKKVQEDFSKLKELTKDISKKDKVMFILSMNGGRVLTSGRNTAAAAMIKMAGGENAITGMEGYKPIADEVIVSSRPTAILMMDRGGDHSIKNDELFKIASFSLTPVAKTRKVIRINGLYLLGFGPRTASAARDLADKLYGQSKSASVSKKKQGE